jgi:acetyltransferase-like isoleucine patch superfamily enzyme
MSSLFSDRMGNQLSWQEATPKITNRLNNYMLDLKLAVLWLCVSQIPFHSIRNTIYRISGIKIGNNSTIHIGARFYQPKNISIGEGTIIGDHATLDGRAPLSIGNNVDIASEVMIFNSHHDIHSNNMKPIEKPVEIGDYVFIGPRAIILPGVKIGKGAVVAAGAVVTKDVKRTQVVAGVPAEKISNRKVSNLNYRLGRFRLFQ